MPNEEMKILVIDSQGGDGISARYRELLPHVRLRGVEMAPTVSTPCHPHGLMAGYYAACLLHEANGFEPGEAEVVFVRIFDRQGMPVRDGERWMLDIIKRERPDIVTRSWGGIHASPRQGALVWGEWVDQYRALQADIGFIDFGAAGNSGNWLPDDNVAYPQNLMPEVCNIIGSCRRDGLPSEWSGDGQSVQCLAWGERIYLNNNGSWELGSGTSFSCPKMAGLCAVARVANTTDWRLFVGAEATRPAGYEKVRSAKWGVGNMEDAFQFMLRSIPAASQPPSGPLRVHNLRTRERWFEFSMIL